MHGKFPTVPIILLIVAVLWGLSDLKVIEVDLPWFPIILGIIALGWIVNKYLPR